MKQDNTDVMVEMGGPLLSLSEKWFSVRGSLVYKIILKIAAEVDATNNFK